MFLKEEKITRIKNNQRFKKNNVRFYYCINENISNMILMIETTSNIFRIPANALAKTFQMNMYHY